MCVSSDFLRGRKTARDGGECSDRRAGMRQESVTARRRKPPPLCSDDCARALAGQRVYHRVRFRREGCLREPSRSFAIARRARSALHRPGSEECGAAARPLPGRYRDDACTSRYYTVGTCTLRRPAYYYDERRHNIMSEATRRRSITRSARTDINDDHEIITIIM